MSTKEAFIEKYGKDNYAHLFAEDVIDGLKYLVKEMDKITIAES